MFRLRQLRRGRERWPPGRRSHLCGRSGSLSWQSRYRRDLSWRQATAQAGQGERYDQILRLLIPTTALAAGERHAQPAIITQSESLAGEKNAAVAAYIQAETGYNEPDVFAVCRLVSGSPIPIGSRNGCLFVTSLRFRSAGFNP